MFFVVAFVSALALTAALSISTECPPVNCADPTYRENCPSCEHSNCTLEGCVQHTWHGTIWRPDPCTVCQCIAGQKSCYEVVCHEPECFGYPNTTKPNHCCPECDWGIANNECGPIPVAWKSLYVALGDNHHCQKDVLVHECDKRIVWKDGKYYRCKPITRGTPVWLENCEGVRRVVIDDISECILKKIKFSEVPQDFDPNPDICVYRV